MPLYMYWYMSPDAMKYLRLHRDDNAISYLDHLSFLCEVLIELYNFLH